MRMGFFKGIKDSDGNVEKEHNGWWNTLQAWWNDHDSGAKAWTVVKTNLLKAKGRPGTSADAGDVGEVISGSALRSAPVSVSASGTQVNITSISLTAGNWDVKGQFSLTQTGGTVTVLQGGISTTSASLAGADTISVPDATGQVRSILTFSFALTGDISGPTLNSKISVTSTTVYYLVATANYVGGSSNVYGSLIAVRI